MVDFPTSLVDFQRRFPDEAACATWLFEARWNRPFAARPAGLAARGKGFPLRMRRLRQANLRHGGDDHARLEASSDRLVLGRLS